MLTILSLRSGVYISFSWIWECLEPLQKWYVSSGSMSWKVIQFLPASLGMLTLIPNHCAPRIRRPWRIHVQKVWPTDRTGSEFCTRYSSPGVPGTERHMGCGSLFLWFLFAPVAPTSSLLTSIQHPAVLMTLLPCSHAPGLVRCGGYDLPHTCSAPPSAGP